MIFTGYNDKLSNDGVLSPYYPNMVGRVAIPVLHRFHFKSLKYSGNLLFLRGCGGNFVFLCHGYNIEGVIKAYGAEKGNAWKK